MNGITKETFLGYDTDSKLNTLFDYIHDISEKQKAICTHIINTKNHGDRIEKLEKRKRVDSAFSGVMGFFGGFISFMSTKFI